MVHETYCTVEDWKKMKRRERGAAFFGCLTLVFIILITFIFLVGVGVCSIWVSVQLGII